MNIDSIEQLRALYAAPKERALRKQLAFLDPHCRRFVELSPFVVVASCGADRSMDASPRGGPPGFVKAVDERTLLVPDASGNNRLDTLENIIETGKVGLLFMIPGVDETLRANGTARLSRREEHLVRFAGGNRAPKLVIEVAVTAVYLHCAKALMRSALWSPASQVDRSVLPTMGEMLKSQTGMEAPAESQAEMLERYRAEL